MTFRDHLIELRSRLLRSVVMVFACAAACLVIADELYYYLSLPMLSALPAGSQLIVTGPIEYFLVVLKITATAGLFISSPWILYQVWAFVAPGLYQHERRYAGAFVVFGSTFFIGGAAFCYLVVFPTGLPILVGMNPPDVLGMYKVGEYYSFAVRLLIAFGLAFELPVIQVLLCLLGVVRPEQLSSVRKYALVGSFVLSAILTPPDVISQVSMALPLYLLYEAGLVVSYVLVRRRAADTTNDDEEKASPLAG